MYIHYLGKVAIASLIGLTLATGCSSATPVSNSSQEEIAPVSSSANPCAGAPIAATEVAANGVAESAPAEVGTSPEIAQAIRYFVDGNNIAIRGTDPVAYFTQGAAVAGRAEFTHTWNNAVWQFASAENRDAFAANPEAYAPQYGGFCAWAVSQGYTASIDPNAWKIVDGKLYLNYSRGVQRTWERDIPGNISRANSNWPGVLAGS
ncbi:MAG: YHS domain-containing (seleno)protein [Cyanobacteria bacterium J06642_11]